MSSEDAQASQNQTSQDDQTSPTSGGVFGRLTNYGDLGFSRFIRRAFLNSAGLDDVDLDRPVVGIVNTTSDFTTCHREMPQLIEAVKRGVLEAGGIPFVFPVMSLGEILTNPTTMLFRNLMAMELEEQLTSQPMDSVVLLGGCDKTVPAELMAAASADVPAIQLVVGPMTVGDYQGERLGACTDCRRMWTEYRSGRVGEQEIAQINAELAPSAGTCMVMGTASTMACVVEAMGMSLPFAGTAPSVSSQRLRISAATGRQAVELARSGRRPSEVMTAAAFRNAIIVLAAIAGSTNAVIHLTAIARRLGLDVGLDDFHDIAQQVPVLVNCKPAGANYLPDLHRDGGVPALLTALADVLDLDVLTVTGKTLRDQLADVDGPQDYQDTIRTLDDPLQPPGALVTLYGSLAPAGAVIKAAAASPQLMVHEGVAHVFDSLEEVEATLDDESLQLTPEHVLIMRNIGPVGAGMPEAGSIPIPKYLARQGVRDMVRISDGRMSGTAYGTIVLHVSPEAAVGGPLALVRTGDRVRLDVPGRTVDLLVDDAELARRRAALALPGPPARGWRRLYATTVNQADQGADLDFLR
jgi:dihydroxy-acid dehydratase